MKNLKFASAVIALILSTSVNAVSLPAPVESIVNGSIDVVDNMGSHIGAAPVDFNPTYGDFDFTYLGSPGVGYNSSFYTSPGTYTFMSTPDAVFPTSIPISMTVGNNQMGMRTFIDWNSNTYDILTVWDVVTTGDLTTLMAIDLDGDGVRGFLMPNGPFAGFNVIIDATIVTPVPAAVWLFGSGLIALIGFAKRRKA